MPPKKKKGGGGAGGGKGKAGRRAVAGLPQGVPGSSPVLGARDGVLTQDLSKEQLEEHILRMREELEREREERNYFQLERDKMHTFWEISKKQLEEAREEVRGKEREVEEAEENQEMQVKVYKQKVKHLMFEQENRLSEAKAESLVAQRVGEEELREKELELRKQKHDINVHVRRDEAAQEEFKRDAILEHDKKVTEVRRELQDEVKGIEKKYQVKIERIRKEMDDRRRSEIREIEDRKNQQITALTKNHERAFVDLKNYYNDITLNNLALIKRLEQQLENSKAEKSRITKQLSDTVAEKKQLSEPFHQMSEEVVVMRRELDLYAKDKHLLLDSKAKLRVAGEQLAQLQWEHELLEQKFQQTEKERDELYTKFERVIQEVQQKAGLKETLLEEKLQKVQRQLETREAELGEVLTAGGMDVETVQAVTRNLSDVIEGKNQTIDELKTELARISKTHHEVVSSYQAQLEGLSSSRRRSKVRPTPGSGATRIS